ncbi:MAG: DNA/RNA nuclease SfsA [Pseudomonadota bacterium]
MRHDFPPLERVILKQRYKRFLADVEREDGSEITVHCPNPGSMLGLKTPGSVAYISDSGNDKRKLRHTLEVVDVSGELVSINTMRPNRIARMALQGGALPALGNIDKIEPEMPYGEKSRVDFRLTDPNGRITWLEVKNCHLVRTPGLYEFPDSVTSRGARHLDDLAAQVANGDKAVLLFIIQRGDGDRLSLARDLDPAYAAAHARATAAGVITLCLRCTVDLKGVWVRELVPYIASN